MGVSGKRRVGRRAHLSGKEKRPKCEKDGFCADRDWEGRCLDPQRGCEHNEYERILLKARKARAERALGEVNERLRAISVRRELEAKDEGVKEGQSPGEEKEEASG